MSACLAGGRSCHPCMPRGSSQDGPGSPRRGRLGRPGRSTARLPCDPPHQSPRRHASHPTRADHHRPSASESRDPPPARTGAPGEPYAARPAPRTAKTARHHRWASHPVMSTRPSDSGGATGRPRSAEPGSRWRSAANAPTLAADCPAPAREECPRPTREAWTPRAPVEPASRTGA